MKKWFDYRLFRDAMKQLHVGGLVAGLVLLLQAILLPIGRIVNWQVINGEERKIMTLWNIFPAGLLLFCVIAPLMALFLFRFLSRRNACDFYHSLPQTRTCLYNSFAAAVLCWTFLLQTAGTLTAVLMHLVFPRHFDILMPSVLWGSLCLAACVLFVTGAVLLAVTLTGNILTNLAVSLLIIFFPRLVMLVVKGCVGESLTIVSDEYLSFLGGGWNAVTDTVFNAFSSQQLGYTGGGISAAYTAGLGLIYLILGGVMFSRRRSESAGEASITPLLQTFFRLLPAAVVCLIPNVRVFALLAGCEELSTSDIYSLFVLYLVGIFVYFIYELLSTRKIRNLIRAIPGLALLLGFNLLMIFGMLGLRHNLLSFTPDAGQIDSVQMVSRTSYIGTSDGEYSAMPGYLSTREEEIELTDMSVRQLLAARLRETVEYDSTPIAERDMRDYRVWNFVIHSGGKAVHRNVMLLNADLQLLAKALQNNPQVQEIYMNLPDKEEVSLSIDTWGYDSGGPGVREPAEEELGAIYDALQEDIADMGFEKWYAYCADAKGGDFTLYMRVSDEHGTTGSAFPIRKETPRARGACLDVVWKMQEQARGQLLSELKALQACQEVAGANTIVTYNDNWIYANLPGEDEAIPYYVDVTNKKGTEILIELLEKYGNTSPEAVEGFMSLSVNIEYMIDGRELSESEEILLANDTASFRSVYGYFLLPLAEDEDFSRFHAVIG